MLRKSLWIISPQAEANISAAEKEEIYFYIGSILRPTVPLMMFFPYLSPASFYSPFLRAAGSLHPLMKC